MSKRGVATIIEDIKGEGVANKRLVWIVDSDEEEDYGKKKIFKGEVLTNGTSHVTLAVHLREAELNVIGEFNGAVSNNNRLLSDVEENVQGDLGVLKTVGDYVESEEGRVSILDFAAHLYDKGGGGGERRPNLSDVYNAVIDFQASVYEVNKLMQDYSDNAELLKGHEKEISDSLFTLMTRKTDLIEYENIILLQLLNLEAELKEIAPKIRKIYHASLNKYKQRYEEMIRSIAHIQN